MQVLSEIPDIRAAAIAAGSDYKGLAKLVKLAKLSKHVNDKISCPDLVAIYDKSAACELQKLLPDIEVAAGMEGLIDCVKKPGVQIVVNAIVGSIGLAPTLAALNAKKDVALANKETLVAGGSLVMEAARQNNVSIRPTDSEHSAIWQCLQGNEKSAVKRLILTASGGAFRTWEKFKIEKAKATEALHHPNWTMGPKITIDCATMMNKGLEYIEAHWLFDIPYEKIEILIHPQSIIHSMVEFEDGAVMAQMAMPDMCQPIQYALSAPARFARKHTPIDFLNLNALTFEEPDFDRFPCLALAMKAAEIGGTMPAMMNAVNEKVNAAYLQDEVGFYDISEIITEAMGTYTVKPVCGLSDVEEAIAWADEFLVDRIG